jgi:hypothetical protein
MPINDRKDYFVQKYVMEFGFLGGAFFALGIDPDPTSIGIMIIKTLNASFPNEYAGVFIFILTVIGFLILAYTLREAWLMGGKLGSFCIVLAWIGGLMVIKFSLNTSSIQLGAIMVIAAAFLGRYTVN